MTETQPDRLWDADTHDPSRLQEHRELAELAEWVGGEIFHNAGSLPLAAAVEVRAKRRADPKADPKLVAD